ncbi:hypothetical protein KXR53_15255 [Inquilinus limosus]|uniref:hypothetical protein n=1 Tax=Inquilinus limosus TaxID=171674 RepID=UPI003F146A9B
MGRREPSTIGTLVFLMWGLVVWGLQLTAIYVGHAWLCALGAPADATALLAVVLTILAVAAILPVAWSPSRPAALAGLKEPAGDLRHLMAIARVVALLSIVAAIWTGATAIFIKACELAR